VSPARLVLWLSAPAYGLVGGLFLLAPAWAGALVGLEIDTPTADNDVRAVYGGLGCALAVFLYWAGSREDWYFAGIAVQMLTMGGLSAARVVSWGVVGWPSGLALVLHAGETIGFLAGLWAWRAIRGGSPASRGEGAFLVRALEGADYPAVRALWERSPGVGLSETDTPAKTAAFLAHNPPGLSGIATDADGNVIGVILCGHDGRRGQLYHLAVDESWSGRGVAKSLVAHALAGLAGCGIDKCNLLVFDENTNGAAFWTANGFAEREDLKIHQRIVAHHTVD
jgi:ribosomal protein S18 acetylase RimI-like enzyme